MLIDCLNLETLREKAQALKKRKFKPGFDQMNADAAAIWVDVNGEHMIKEVLSGQYIPMPAVGFITAKQKGGYRQLCKLTAIDTLLQLILLDVLNASCETKFSNSSFAYRPGRGLSAALKRFCELGSSYPYIAKVDPKACYDNIDHTILYQAIQSFTSDALACDLVQKYIAMPVLSEGQLLQRNKGILQGAPISPILCNIYLHSLDMAMEAQNIPFIRYADDIAVFGRSASEASDAAIFVSQQMESILALTVNKNKSKVSSVHSIRYLGHRFEQNRYNMIALATNDTEDGAWRSWYRTQGENDHRITDILSDGVLRQKDFTLLFESDQSSETIPVKNTEMLNIYSSIILDSRVLELALRNRIYINLFDRHGSLLGRFTPNVPLKAPKVTHEQLMTYYDDCARMQIAREILVSALHNIRLNIRYYLKQHPNDTVLEDSLYRLKKYEPQLKQCLSYEDLLMIEAGARKEYYGCFDFILSPDEFFFDHRSRRPPKNPVNAMISFGNTVLYNLIAFKINRSPLDIRVGFVHATNLRKESLNLDIAELFKPLIVDRVIFTLVNRKVITEEHFEEVESGGIFLTPEGKRLFLRAFYEKLRVRIKEKGREMSYDELIDAEIQKLVRHFRNGEKYRAFRQVK